MTVHALTDDLERYLTKQQVAVLLGFSIRWIEVQIRDHGLPAYTVGGQRRFLWSEVQAWLRDAA